MTRTLTLTLFSADGKLSASTDKLPVPDTDKTGPWLVEAMVELERRLDVLERDGPWKTGELGQPPSP